MLFVWFTIQKQKIFYPLPINNVLPTSYSNRRNNKWALEHKIILGTRTQINETKAMAQAALVFLQNTIQWFPVKFV